MCEGYNVQKQDIEGDIYQELFEIKEINARVRWSKMRRKEVTPLGSWNIDLLAVCDVTSCLSLTQPESRP